MGLTVIMGPPASGKTTWVREHAKPGDIVIDFDLFAAALTVDADPYDHPRHIVTVASAARQAAITEALKMATRHTVYLIDAQPRPGTLARYHRAGARIITIDPGPAVVMARCREHRPPAALEIAQRWYSSNTTTRTGVEVSRRW